MTMPDNSSYFPGEGKSPRQQRIADLVDEGRTIAEATGLEFVERAGLPQATNQIDEPGD